MLCSYFPTHSSMSIYTCSHANSAVLKTSEVTRANMHCRSLLATFSDELTAILQPRDRLRMVLMTMTSTQMRVVCEDRTSAQDTADIGLGVALRTRSSVSKL